jgi:hypothetical protein
MVDSGSPSRTSQPKFGFERTILAALTVQTAASGNLWMQREGNFYHQTHLCLFSYI